MKILLSAYACEPNKGSEPGVGWNWALELTKLDHDVWVLTRKNNQHNIENELLKYPQKSNLHFIYYDLPPYLRRLKKGGYGIHLYYLLWQWIAFKKAKKIHSKLKFDVVHHVTFASVRQPSFMGNLGIPFIFGPVGGGESAPWHLRIHYGFKGFLLDTVRDIANLLVKIDPFMRQTFHQAKEIYVTSEQTKKIIPSQYHLKTKVQLAVALDTFSVKNSVMELSNHGYRILFIGRLLYWKGMGLGLRAFAKLKERIPEATLTIVGMGPEKRRWQKLAEKLKIQDRICWIHRANKTELSNIYNDHDILLFPSLHDSGGMVVLEALAHGLPVVCLDLGGPGAIISRGGGINIKTSESMNPNVIIEKIYESLIHLHNKPNHYTELSQKALITATNHNWKNLISKVEIYGKLKKYKSLTHTN